MFYKRLKSVDSQVYGAIVQELQKQGNPRGQIFILGVLATRARASCLEEAVACASPCPVRRCLR